MSVSTLTRLSEAVESGRTTTSRMHTITGVLDFSVSMRSQYRGLDDEAGGPSRIEAMLNGINRGFEAMRGIPFLSGAEACMIRFATDVRSDGYQPIATAKVTDDGFSGGTMMGAGLARAYELLSAKHQEAAQSGRSLGTSLVVVVSDGMTGDIEDAKGQAAKFAKLADRGKIILLAAGLCETDCQYLRDLQFPSVLNLDHITFDELFRDFSITAMSTGQLPTDERLF